MLKAEYDKLRTKYSEDLKHWKEWKAKEMARIERKKQTREVRRNAKTAASDSTAEALDSSQIKLVSASDESQPNEAVASPDRDVQRSSPTVEGCIHEAQEREFDEDEDMTHCIDSGKPLADRPGAFQNAYGRTNPTEQDTTPRSKAFISAVEINPKERSTDTPLPHILNPLHPTHSEDRRRIAQASRVTPWLGAPVISPDDNRHGHTALKADEMFGTPDDLDNPSYLPVTNASAKTPLVRDRLGPMMSVSSVRKQTPRRTLETDANDRERASPTSSSSRSRASRKRLLDLENLSPAERVIRLKQLSKMPTAAKRDYYADYKGRGRYVPPEAVYVHQDTNRSTDVDESKPATGVRRVRD